MKKYITILLILGFTELFAQQEQKFSLYMFNKMMYNPAAAGANKDITLSTGYRNQWQGIELAPNSKFLSIDASLPYFRNKIGVGLMINNHEIGLINNSSINLSLAYKTRLSDNSWISMGGATEIKKRSFNVAKMSILDQSDIAFPQVSNSLYQPNYHLGIFYHSTNKFLGVSIFNLYPESINYSGIERPITGSEGKFFNISAGYDIELNKLFTFKQTLLLKSDFNSLAQIDLTPSIQYKGNYEFGISYRHGQSVVGIFQATILNQLKLGYGYDYETSGLSTYQNGSHEIMLTYTFIKQKKIMAHPRFFNL